MHKKQLEHQQQDTGRKQEEGRQAMMMLHEPVVERPGADAEGQEHHGALKDHVMDDVHAEERQGRHA